MSNSPITYDTYLKIEDDLIEKNPSGEVSNLDIVNEALLRQTDDNLYDRAELENLIFDLRILVNQAQASATSADSKATSAQQSATAAQQSAAAADQKAGEAKSSADSAMTKANSAQSAATSASQSAQTALTAADTANTAAVNAKAAADAAKATADAVLTDISTVSLLRVYRGTTLSLSTSWQKIDFPSASNPPSINKNTFGKTSSGKSNIEYDTAAGLFKVNATRDYNLTAHFAAVCVTTGVGVKANLQYRVVVPNGGGIGIDFYFPLPDVQGNAWIDMGEITTLLNSEMHPDKFIPIYVENTIRANGFYIQVRLSNALAVLATASITRATFIIQATGK